MTTDTNIDGLLSASEADLAKAAQRCIMKALDHSRAAKIILSDEAGATPSIALPPKSLKVIAEVLGLMGQGLPIVLMPQRHELTTQDAANLLNVSRPFIVKEIEAGNIPHRKVGRHRRIAYEDLLNYKRINQQRSLNALQDLANLSQELGMDY
jgi:excisionase family DNA binding protein